MLLKLKRLSAQSVAQIAAGMIALAGGGAAAYSSANGPWGNQDAAVYIVTARNLLRGIGYGYRLPNGSFVVWTVKPPLYSAVLAVIGRFGADLVDAARWLNVLFFAASLLLAALIFVRFSERPALGIVAALLVAAFPTMVRMSSSSMSEPFFVFTLLLSVYLLLALLRTGTYRRLIPAAILAGLLPMVRYIGVAFIPVGLVAVLGSLAGGWKERLAKTSLYALISGLPILTWAAWVYFAVDRSVAGRSLVLGQADVLGNLIRFYSSTVQIALSWFPLGGQVWDLRFGLRNGTILLAVVLLVGITLLAVRRLHRRLAEARADADFQNVVIWWLWSAAYVAFLAIDSLVANPNPPITNRILLPLYAGLPLCLVGMLACWQKAWFRGRLRWLQALPWLVAVGGLVWYLPVTYSQVMLPLHSQTGLISYGWRVSPTMAAVRALPRDTIVVSSDAYAVMTWADRSAYDLLENLEPDFIHHDAVYGTDSTDPAQDAFRQGAVLVVFADEFPGQIASAYGQAGTDRLSTLFRGLTIAGQYADGTIYYFPK